MLFSMAGILPAIEKIFNDPNDLKVLKDPI